MENPSFSKIEVKMEVTGIPVIRQVLAHIAQRVLKGTRSIAHAPKEALSLSLRVKIRNSPIMPNMAVENTSAVGLSVREKKYPAAVHRRSSVRSSPRYRKNR